MKPHGIVLVLLSLCATAYAAASCDEQISARVEVGAGNPWTAPFGLARVGAPPEVLVELDAALAPSREYFVVAYRNGRETQRLTVQMRRDEAGGAQTQTDSRSRFFGAARLVSVPTEVALNARCPGDGLTTEITREAVSWPNLEADVRAQPDRRINPVDLGAILVPNDWLLLSRDQSTNVEAVAISHDRDIRGARIRAWFDGDKAVNRAMPLKRDRRARTELLVPPPKLAGDGTMLNVVLLDGDTELWRKQIRTMLVAQPPRVPAFGAVESKLRYDAPIPVRDFKGGARSTISYDTAWDPELNDVVVFLPNGSRFVFWRGSSYVPFWASLYNTGFSYEWVETTHPEDGVDSSVEPLGDKELRYGRVRIVESTASRVHVRWTYQPTHHYRVWGDQADEDYYFYPDGFGVRALTLSSEPNWNYELSEFIALTPQGAYPLDVLQPTIDVVYLDGEKQRFRLPGDYPASGRLEFTRQAPRVFRIFPQQQDAASAIYFSARDIPRTLIWFAPFVERGQRISAAYWGSHWPLSRDESFARDLIASAPAHNSLVTWGLSGTGKYSVGNNPEPLFVGTAPTVDTLGRARVMMTRRWAWLIGKTDAADDALRAWAQSYTSPPALEVKGARLDAPAYSPERRALRLVVEAPTVEIRLKPAVRTMNPVFELEAAPRELAWVTLNSKPLAPGTYAWDGATLWMEADIGAAGATIVLSFQQTSSDGSH